MTECEKYSKEIAKDLIAIYDGTTDELNGDGEKISFFDWLCSDVLDFETVRDSQKQFVGAFLYVTLGGPCCYVDTRRNEVVTIWGTDTGRAWLPGEVADCINDCMIEMEM